MCLDKNFEQIDDSEWKIEMVEKWNWTDEIEKRFDWCSNLEEGKVHLEDLTSYDATKILEFDENFDYASTIPNSARWNLVAIKDMVDGGSRYL
jgi:hypothetical protein